MSRLESGDARRLDPAQVRAWTGGDVLIERLDETPAEGLRLALGHRWPLLQGRTEEFQELPCKLPP